jgi:hypothetical protein
MEITSQDIDALNAYWNGWHPDIAHQRTKDVSRKRISK